MFLSIKLFTQLALSYLMFCSIFHWQKTLQQRKTARNCGTPMKSSIVIFILRSIKYYCYCTVKSLDVCIFARFKVKCKVIHLRSLAIFKLIMSRHKELRGAIGHGLFDLCVNLSLDEGVSYRQAANNFGVHKMTLLRYMKKQADPDYAVGYASKSFRHRIIPADMEKDHASHISCLADMCYVLSLEKCKQLL